MPSLDNFIAERPLFNRERSAGVYSVLPFYLARSIVDILSNIVAVTITASVAYWMAHLHNDAGRFFLYLAIIYLSVNVAASLFSFIGTVSRLYFLFFQLQFQFQIYSKQKQKISKR